MFPTLVKDLFEWEVRHLSSHPLFRRLSEDEKQSDPVVEKLFESSEEGQKVSLTAIIKYVVKHKSAKLLMTYAVGKL